MEIDLRARRIDDVRTEHDVTLVVSGGAVVRIECPFDLTESPVTSTTVDPENLGADRQFELTLRGKVIDAATADEELGSLSISFLGGLALTVPSDPRFEAWAARWEDGSMVIALPGGGLSSWGARR